MRKRASFPLLCAVAAAASAFVPNGATADDTFPDEGYGSAFLAQLSTNYVKATKVDEGLLQRLDNSKGKYLPMIGGEDMLFRLTHDDGTYEHLHVFTNTLGKTLSLQDGYVIKDATIFLIAGGGGGGTQGGGGGGGGGLVRVEGVRMRSGDYAVEVGVGGKAGYRSAYNAWTSQAAHNGADSVVTYMGLVVDELCRAIGGGRGASVTANGNTAEENALCSAAGSGGSGGGGGYLSTSPVPGTPGQGFEGGFKSSDGGACGGGGGAGGSGRTSGQGGVWGSGGAGGPGLDCDIMGFTQCFAGGGGGGVNETGSGGAAGSGGGGRGSNRSENATAGSNGLGGGGGGGGSGSGGQCPQGGKGGDGIVIIRYKGDPKPTGLIIRVQ